MTEKILINARIIDPSQNMDEKGSVIIDANGKIKSIGKSMVLVSMHLMKGQSSNLKQLISHPKMQSLLHTEWTLVSQMIQLLLWVYFVMVMVSTL